MLDSIHIGTPGEGSRDQPITLQGVKASEMASLLTLLSARAWAGPPVLDEEGWAAALYLATMYSFRDVRNYIIKFIDEKEGYNPVRLIEMAMRCEVPKWILPSYIALCKQPDHIPHEAARLGIPVYTALCRIREQALKKGVTGLMQKTRPGLVCVHSQPSGPSWLPPGHPQWRPQAPCDQCVANALETLVPEQEYVRLIKAAAELGVPNDDELVQIIDDSD